MHVYIKKKRVYVSFSTELQLFELFFITFSSREKVVSCFCKNCLNSYRITLTLTNLVVMTRGAGAGAGEGRYRHCFVVHTAWYMINKCRSKSCMYVVLMPDTIFMEGLKISDIKAVLFKLTTNLSLYKSISRFIK